MQEAAIDMAPHEYAKAPENDQVLEVLHQAKTRSTAAEVIVTSRPLERPPANPPKISPKDFAIYMGGFVFSQEQMARLCVDAWGISEVRVKNAGPPNAAAATTAIPVAPIVYATSLPAHQ